MNCSICLENYTDKDYKNNIYILECGHKFHKNCIIDWITECMINNVMTYIRGVDGITYPVIETKNIKYNCPYCRKQFELDENGSFNFTIYNHDSLNNKYISYLSK